MEGNMDFKTFCNGLERKYRSRIKSENVSYVACAKEYIQHKYTKKSDLLALKVEALDNDYTYYSSMMLSIYSLFIAIVAILMTSCIIPTILVGLVLFLFIPQCVFYKRFRNIRKWKNCILVATEELIAECNDKN